MIGDLHCHTRLSDGSMGIDDLVFHAKRAGLDFVAITDHDTLEGTKRAEVLGRRYGIGTIAGVELSCYDYQRGRKAHLLCYLPDKPDRLQGMMSQTLENRTRAGQKSIAAVMRYYPVTEEHIKRYAAGCTSLYKAHIMQALLDLGYDCRPYGDLFRQLFHPREGLCVFPIEYPDIFKATELVRSAGAVAVLAHPSQYDSFDLLEELAARELIQGVERYHPSVRQEQVPRLEQAIAHYGLFATGGSDFHGWLRSFPCPLATCVTTDDGLNSLFARKKGK